MDEKEAFRRWLEKKNANLDISACIDCLERVSDYVVRHEVYEYGFWQITDCVLFKKLCKHLFSDALFKYQHKSDCKALKKYGKLYSKFLKACGSIFYYDTVNTTAEAEPITCTPEDAPDDDGEVAVAETETASSCNEEEEPAEPAVETLATFAALTPISLTYRGMECDVDGWRGAYVLLLRYIYSDFPKAVEGLVGKPVIGDGGAEISTSPEGMNFPEKVHFSPYYVDAGFGCADICRRMDALLALCGLGLDAVVIRYASEDTEKKDAEIPNVIASSADGKGGGHQKESKYLWNIYESAILLDGCVKISNGQKESEVIGNISNLLRQMAVNEGRDIDDKYRNYAGISLQMYNMKMAYNGMPREKCTKIFKDAVDIYRNERASYDKILVAAYTACGDKEAAPEAAGQPVTEQDGQGAGDSSYEDAAVAIVDPTPNEVSADGEGADEEDEITDSYSDVLEKDVEPISSKPVRYKSYSEWLKKSEKLGDDTVRDYVSCINFVSAYLTQNGFISCHIYDLKDFKTLRSLYKRLSEDSFFGHNRSLDAFALYLEYFALNNDIPYLSSTNKEINRNPKEPGWSMFEAAVLLDGTMKRARKQMTSDDAIRYVSDNLRGMAVQDGCEIDAEYCNDEYVRCQMRRMLNAYFDNDGDYPASFIRVVAEYKTNRPYFKNLVALAVQNSNDLRKEGRAHKLDSHTDNEKDVVRGGRPISVKNFNKWMEDCGVPDAYDNAMSLSNLKEFVQRKEIIPYDSTLFEIDDTELMRAFLDKLTEDSKFGKLDSGMRGAYISALKEYLKYLESLPKLDSDKSSSGQPDWSLDESVILLDGVISLNIGRNLFEVVNDISVKLRRMAESKGDKIDDMYRDLSDVSLQMSRMRRIFDEKSDEVDGVFMEAYNIYKTDIKKYYEMLRLVKAACDLLGDGNLGMFSNEDEFLDFLDFEDLDNDDKE